MGSDFIATVVPRLDDYTEPVTRADALTLATAACRAQYQGEYGEIADDLRERLSDGDTTAVELVVAQPDLIAAIRAAALRGAQHAHRANTEYFCSGTYRASDLGGPDVIVVGGDAWDRDPFEGFRDTAVLAAILAIQNQP